MKTIFKALQEKMENGKGDVFRVSYNNQDGVSVLIMIGENPIGVDDPKYFKVEKYMGVMLSVRERHHGVISTRKDKDMVMTTNVVMAPTWFPTSRIFKVEFVDDVEDVENLITILDTAKKEFEKEPEDTKD